MSQAGGSLLDALPVVRGAVKDLLTASPAFHDLPEVERRELAQSMVKVCHTALDWLREEIRSDGEYKTAATGRSLAAERPAPIAKAQAVEFGEAAKRIGQTTHDVLNAVSFPRFVSELISGVFKAMLDSNQQQMHSFVDLLRNVSATTDGFADANLGPDRARLWLAEKYPGSFAVTEEEADDSGWEDEPASNAPRRFRLGLRSGAEWPPDGALRTDLGLAEDESVGRGDPERTLLPLARRALARQKQQMLATMVLMGLQRIVIESGRIHASMRFHIDTRSALAEDRGSSFDFRNTVAAAGSFGFGPWGVSASVQNTIGYVSTQRTQTTEELNTELDLNSSVEIIFRTDHVPLEVLAGKEARERIKVNTLNPNAEAESYQQASAARRKAAVEGEAGRRQELSSALKPPPSHESILPEVPKPMPESEANEMTVETPAGDSGGEAAPANGGGEGGGGTPAGDAGDTAGGDDGGEAAGLSLAASEDTEVTRLRSPDVVWVPTPMSGVTTMLELAELGPNDVLYDLGCGDGRIVVAAAQRYGCRAIGFDIDPARVKASRDNVRKAGVADRVEIRHQDLFTVDVSGADVVTLYLLPELNRKLLPQLRRLKPGSRIVSHDFALGNVAPERMLQIPNPERNTFRTFYRWRAPLPAVAEGSGLTATPDPRETHSTSRASAARDQPGSPGLRASAGAGAW